jgi:isoleucyl-tRNA synthetase
MSNKKYYPNPDNNINFNNLETGILEKWNKNNTFEKSIENRKKNSKSNNDNFVFFDGPPFANGLPHYGHILAGYVKDTVARYQTMKGKIVERKFGWDCHGLPVEMGVEKNTGINGRSAIMEYGIEKFNDHCKDDIMKYVNEWREHVNRSGRWVDFENSYKTMDLNYMESVIWVFKQLYDKGLLYEDYRVMPYSWKCQTPVSNFETKMDNSYREKADKAVTVKFKLLANDIFKVPVHVLAWTTTPWTLPSNLALAINKEFAYVLIKKDENNYIICKNALARYKKELSTDENFEILEEFAGSKLIGLKYEPLMNYLKDLEGVKENKNCFSILHADFVTSEDGTGTVHIAPGFGEDDNAVSKLNNIPTICPVDDAGCFTETITDYAGKQVFDANEPIIIKLKEEGKWLKTEQYLHNYPHCWRTDTPLIYRAMSSWYVKVTAIKDKIIKNNQSINWIPEHVKNGRFGKWIEGAIDWSITRNRFWGCPVPVWKSNDPKYPRIDVYGSLDEIEKDFRVRPKDLHRPYIDRLTRKNPDDPTGNSLMVRVPDVLDCWFESGSMPYAQFHYPFENKEFFENNFPADFIAEGDGQIRGWFYTLLVLSSALFDRNPFKNCISYGTIVDEEGKKLSKRWRNYVDPKEAFTTYGSDAIRWLMLKSPALKGEEVGISKDGKDMKETLRLAVKPMLNSYNFFCLYANSDNIKAKRLVGANYSRNGNNDENSITNVMDIYILSKLKNTVTNIEREMDSYNIGNACRESEMFFEVLNNWYIRRNRNRFWKTEKDDDKQQAYNTLYTVLVTMMEAVAPLVPFTSEYIWSGLNGC